MNVLTRILVTLLLTVLTVVFWQPVSAAEDDAPASTEAPATESKTPADSAAESSTEEEAPAPEMPVAATPEEPASVTTKLPVQCHSGTILEAEIKDIAVPWVDLDKMLLLKQMSPDSGPVPDEAMILRSPAEGNLFLIISINVKAGRTISRYDYSVEIDGESFPCLAMTWGDSPYDVRRRQFSGAPDQVFLLYEVPAGTSEFTLAPSLSLSIPQCRMESISLRKETAAAESAVSDVEAADTAAAPDTAVTPAAEKTPAVSEEGKAEEKTAETAPETAQAPEKKEPEKASPAPEKKAEKAPANDAGDWF